MPVPDALTFQREVRRTRRRRTSAVVAGVAAAVVVVVGAMPLAGSLRTDADPPPAPQPPATSPAPVPVLVGNHVRWLTADGVLGPELLGPEGPDIETIVGTTPHGVVVLTVTGTLGRIDEATQRLEPLVPDQVRTAYLDDDAVVYENMGGLIRWRGVEPTVQSRDSAQTDQGRLLAAGPGGYVVAGGQDGSLVAHDPEGVHPISLRSNTVTVSGADIGGGIVAVRTEDGAQFFELGGTRLAWVDGPSLGKLAPDGDQYAQVVDSRHRVELVDPRTGVKSVWADLSAGGIGQVGWAPDGDLLVIARDALWRCTGPIECRVVATDPAQTLRLR